MTKISVAEKTFIRGEHVQDARAYLETLMDAAKLPEVSRERLRDAFRGADMGGMKQAVNIEKRMSVGVK
jgi:hypothetical protein